MERRLFRSLMLLITFTVGLIFVIVHFSAILGYIGRFLAVCAPIFVGFAIAFILNRPCAFFRRCLGKLFGDGPLSKLALPLAVILSYACLVGLLALVFVFIIPQLIINMGRFADNLGGYINQAQVWLNDLLDWLNLQNFDLHKVEEALNKLLSQATSALTTALPQLVNLTTNLVSIVITAVMSLVLSVYMLAGKDRLLSHCKRFTKAYLPEKVNQVVMEVVALTAGTFSKFVVGQVTDACSLGLMTFLGMLIFRFEYAPLVGVLIGVFALIPMVGIFIGGAIAALLLAMIDPMKAVWFLVMLVCIQQFEGNVVYPRIVGSSLGLPGIWVVIAVTVGSGLFGFVGLALAVPTTSVIYTLVKGDMRHRLGELAEDDTDD